MSCSCSFRYHLRKGHEDLFITRIIPKTVVDVLPQPEGMGEGRDNYSSSPDQFTYGTQEKMDFISAFQKTACRVLVYSLQSGIIFYSQGKEENLE